ncbi:MAG: acyl carrier protein [Myxococcales bacterium]|nr:acyl carrier protein [Myxococcales bacterium]
MSNREKLKKLILDVFLLDESEFSFELQRAQVDTWDSLGVVSLAVGVHQTFGYHFTPEEATSIQSVADVIKLLETKGISFDA